MKQLVEGIAKALVDHPDDVVVTEQVTGNKIVVDVTVHSDDKGVIIGRNGRVVMSIQSLCNTAAKEQNQFVKVQIAK